MFCTRLLAARQWNRRNSHFFCSIEISFFFSYQTLLLTVALSFKEGSVSDCCRWKWGGVGAGQRGPDHSITWQQTLPNIGGSLVSQGLLSAGWGGKLLPFTAPVLVTLPITNPVLPEELKPHHQAGIAEVKLSLRSSQRISGRAIRIRKSNITCFYSQKWFKIHPSVNLVILVELNHTWTLVSSVKFTPCEWKHEKNSSVLVFKGI